MNRICRTVYDPLFAFCEPLHRAFPEALAGFDELCRCREALDWSLFDRISPGCTKDILLACIEHDPVAFFADADNAFVGFLGGRAVFDRMVESERAAYWGNDHLVQVVRQCMVLSALRPLTGKLEAIVDRIPRSSSGTVPPASIVQSMLKDPALLTSMMGMMDSPDGMRTLVDSLRRIVEGMLTQRRTERPEAAAPAVTNVETSAEDVDSEPGAVFRRQRATLQRVRATSCAKDPGDTLLSMLDNISLDDTNLSEVSSDLKAMRPEDMTSILGDVTQLMGGRDIQSMLGGFAAVFDNKK